MKIYSTDIMPFNYSGYSLYKVEFDFTDLYRPLQRHIFINPDSNENIEDWIPTWLTKEDIKNYDK